MTRGRDPVNVVRRLGAGPATLTAAGASRPAPSPRRTVVAMDQEKLITHPDDHGPRDISPNDPRRGHPSSRLPTAADLTAVRPTPSEISPRANIGHVNLTVTDLDRSLRFYRDCLGLHITQRDEQSAFLAAGEYHHHIALNTWDEEARTPPPHSAGLHHFGPQAPRQNRARAGRRSPAHRRPRAARRDRSRCEPRGLPTRSRWQRGRADGRPTEQRLAARPQRLDRHGRRAARPNGAGHRGALRGMMTAPPFSQGRASRQSDKPLRRESSATPSAQGCSPVAASRS